MASNIRERAREILSVVPVGQDIASVGGTASLFTQLTGLTQATLQQNWNAGVKLTSCNAFTGWYGRELGSELYLGRFDLETYLPKHGKGHSWVKSTNDIRPKFGDVCRFKDSVKFHVNVSLEFDGDVWTHVDGGQGGPTAGYDIIRRIRDKTAFDPNKLAGWLDIELYFGAAAAQTFPLPPWLPGWWKIMWRSQPFYYYFDRNNQVTWTQVLPINTLQPPSTPRDTGNVAVDTLNDITIRWGATGSIEKLGKSANNQMKGTWNGQEPLSAAKM
jgi:hypothetical protein